MSEKIDSNLKILLVAIFLGLGGCLAAGVITGFWVITAVPVGFLFGFFLEKADLCGSSAFSEMIMMKDREKFYGLAVIIVVSMVGFAVLSALGWIKLNPKPLVWANYIVGGTVFGIGMVLAGGCISGCLFKTGQGNLNSMAGLAGIPLGVAAVLHGPLAGFNKYLEQFIVKNADGSAVTFSSVTGLPYGLLALLFGLAAIMAAVVLKKTKTVRSTTIKQDDLPFLQRIMVRPWKPWQAGLAIGILACFAYLSSGASGRNYPLGVTHGVLHTQLLMTDAPLKHVYAPPVKPSVLQNMAPVQSATTVTPAKKVSWWLILEVMALVLGAFTSAKLSGKIRFIPRPPDQTVVAFFGGLLLGGGAAIAGGCVVGNIMSGVALMSVGNVLFLITVVLANWATTWFYLMGGGLKR